MRLVLGLGLTYSLVFRGWNGGSVGGKNLIPRRFLLFPRAVRSEKSSSGYAAPSAFERHRRCFARDVELIPLSTCHGFCRAQ